MQKATLNDQIARHYSGLSPQLKIAAQYVLDNSHDVAMRSLRYNAGESGLAPPTFSRLARATGYEDYEALRDSCRENLQEAHLSLADRADLLQKTGVNGSDEGKGSFAAIHAHAAVKGIQDLLDSLDLSQLANAADLLVESEKVLLIGSLSSRTMVEYLAHIAQMVASNWEVVGQKGSYISATLTDLSHDDVILAVAMSPYSTETVKAVQFAAQSGAKVIVITDKLSSPVLQYAHFSFLINTDSPQFFPSHVPIITFLEILIGMVVRRLGEAGKNRINAVEQSNHAIGDYWQQESKSTK